MGNFIFKQIYKNGCIIRILCYNKENVTKQHKISGASMKKYRLMTETVEIEFERCKCYGVCASNGDAYGCLTFEKEKAQRLVKELNNENVALCHFKDIIEDFLAEETTASICFFE